ncbi:proteophosphoglycan ppg4 [Rhodotorula toruloides]|uniref:Proteophosphoglycan ppg4 n=1 Tax=Rhodotorula toruloides TaxID=5286 RepID=A0A511KI98_RHOTO|nr:proteophosphoglycan ppg4 [Rhodotorula toruloides]
MDGELRLSVQRDEAGELAGFWGETMVDQGEDLRLRVKRGSRSQLFPATVDDQDEAETVDLLGDPFRYQTDGTLLRQLHANLPNDPLHPAIHLNAVLRSRPPRTTSRILSASEPADPNLSNVIAAIDLPLNQGIGTSGSIVWRMADKAGGRATGVGWGTFAPVPRLQPSRKGKERAVGVGDVELASPAFASSPAPLFSTLSPIQQLQLAPLSTASTSLLAVRSLTSFDIVHLRSPPSGSPPTHLPTILSNFTYTGADFGRRPIADVALGGYAPYDGGLGSGLVVDVEGSLFGWGLGSPSASLTLLNNDLLSLHLPFGDTSPALVTSHLERTPPRKHFAPPTSLHVVCTTRDILWLDERMPGREVLRRQHGRVGIEGKGSDYTLSLLEIPPHANDPAQVQRVALHSRLHPQIEVFTTDASPTDAPRSRLDPYFVHSRPDSFSFVRAGLSILPIPTPTCGSSDDGAQPADDRMDVDSLRSDDDDLSGPTQQRQLDRSDPPTRRWRVLEVGTRGDVRSFELSSMLEDAGEGDAGIGRVWSEDVQMLADETEEIRQRRLPENRPSESHLRARRVDKLRNVLQTSAHGESANDGEDEGTTPDTAIEEAQRLVRECLTGPQGKEGDVGAFTGFELLRLARIKLSSADQPIEAKPLALAAADGEDDEREADQHGATLRRDLLAASQVLLPRSIEPDEPTLAPNQPQPPTEDLPPLHFSYFRPRQGDADDSDEDAPEPPRGRKRKPRKQRAPPSLEALGARLLLGEWHIGADPRSYAWHNPYEGEKNKDDAYTESQTSPTKRGRKDRKREGTAFDIIPSSSSQPFPADFGSAFPSSSPFPASSQAYFPSLAPPRVPPTIAKEPQASSQDWTQFAATQPAISINGPPDSQTQSLGFGGAASQVVPGNFGSRLAVGAKAKDKKKGKKRTAGF